MKKPVAYYVAFFGAGTQLEVVTAVQDLEAADAGAVQTTFQYDLALAQIDQAVGSHVAF